MRKLLILVILLSPTLSLYASDVTDSRVHISIPTGLTAPVLTTLQTEIDKRISTEITTPGSVLEQSAKVADPVTLTMTTDTSLDMSDWQQDIKVTKIYSDAKITSLLITTYEYTGGAHGSSGRTGMVIDNLTGKKISLDDLYETKQLSLRLSPVWQKQIINRLERLMGTKLSVEEKNWVRDGSKDVQQYQSFVITPTLLIIYGQEYQHNAYAYGTQTLIYPRYKIQDILKKVE